MWMAMYRLSCNTRDCLTQTDDFSTKPLALHAARKAGWRITRTTHYCPDCAKSKK